jgi:uncharacterized membrane protein
MTAYQLFGRLHPLVLHFPVALLSLAAALELVRIFRDDARLGKLTVFLLAVGAVGAVLAAGTGWIFAHESHPKEPMRTILTWHRWLGVTTAALSVLAWAAAHRWADDPRRGARWLGRIVVWLAAGLLIVTAHLGALLVWGTDYFS